MVMPMEWYATHLELGELREAEMRAVEQAVNVVERIVMMESANDGDERASEDALEDATEDVTDNVSAQRALQRSITDDLILEFDHADAVETVIDFNSYAEMAPAPWRYALRSDGDFTEPLTRTSSHNELPATDRQHRHRQQQHHQHRRMSRDDLVLLHAASTLRTTISELRELHRELQPQIQARLHAEALQHAGYTHDNDNDDDNHDHFTAAFEGARDWFEALVLQTRLDVQAGVLHSFEGRSERFVKAVYARASFMVANARGSETRGPALTAGGAVDRG